MRHSNQPVVLACLVAALGVAWVLSRQVPAITPLATEPLSTSASLASVSGAKTEAVKPSPSKRIDPFWPPGEPPKPTLVQLVPVAPPPPPPLPVLPFKYFGRMATPDGGQAVFVLRGNEPYEVQLNAILDGQFKVISINDIRIVFEHIASGEKLEMALPAAPKNNSGSGL